MDKLTGRDASGEAYIKHRYVDKDGLCSIERIYGDEAEVFTAYVESGAGPEQVQEWVNAAREGRLVVLPEDGRIHANEPLNGWLVAQVDFGTEAKQIEVITLVKETYLPEYLAEAAQEGRKVTLPCNVGDRIYYRKGNKIESSVVTHIGAGISKNGEWEITLDGMWHVPIASFKGNFYLTRESAQEALSGRTET